MQCLKKLLIASTTVLAVSPAFSNDDRSWLEPYISMRAGYMMLEPKGRQSVYSAPGGVIGAKLLDEELDIETEQAFGIKLAFGGDADLPAIYGRIRLEAEYANNGSFVTPISSSGGNATLETESSALFGNIYYSLNTGTMISPYIGGGLGLSHFVASGDFSSGSFSGGIWKSEYTLGWQASAGFGIYLARGATIDLGYRYSDLGAFKGGVDIRQYTVSGSNVLSGIVLHNDVDIKFRAHEIMLGVRYRI